MWKCEKYGTKLNNEFEHLNGGLEIYNLNPNS